MSGGSWRASAPAFLLGMALAILGEVAAGLLLYGGPGFLPALSVIIAILFVSLAAGFLVDDGRKGRAAVERARRLWLYVLLSFSLAAIFSIGWEVFRGFGARPVTQALGLAVLVALPFHAGGRVLGGLADLPGTRGRGRVAGSALLGGAAGVLAVGFLFFPTLSPTGVILLALVAVSGGALVHGWALDEVYWVDASERLVSRGGVTEIERWMRGSPRSSRLAIRENGRLRALIESDGSPGTPEERAALGFAEGRGSPLGRILSIGVGASVLVEMLRARSEGGAHVVAAGDPRHTRIALDRARRFVAGATAASEPRIVEVEPSTLLHQGTGPFAPASVDWIFVDSLEFFPSPAGVRMPPGEMDRLRALLRPGGVLVVLPLLEISGGTNLFTTFLVPGSRFEQSALYMGKREPVPEVAVPADRGYPRQPIPAGARRAFLVARTRGIEMPETGSPPSDDGPVAGTDPTDLPFDWPESVGGFLRVFRTDPHG